eukprot:3401767-Rhodomonas_salina.1
MSVVASPLGGGGAGAEPLWLLWDAKPSASSLAAVAKHTAPSQTHSLFSRSHAWGPTDNRLALLCCPAAPVPDPRPCSYKSPDTCSSSTSSLLPGTTHTALVLRLSALSRVLAFR